MSVQRWNKGTGNVPNDGQGKVAGEKRRRRMKAGVEEDLVMVCKVDATKTIFYASVKWEVVNG